MSMKNKVQVGDIITVDGETFVVARLHSESVFCRNTDSGMNAYIDYVDIEDVKPGNE